MIRSGASGSRLKILFLGFGLPAALAEKNPELNPAGTLFESRMLAALRDRAEIRYVSILPFSPEQLSNLAPQPEDPSIILTERSPELFWRARSAKRLQASYQTWSASGQKPDVVLCYNLTPIYNAFIRWLADQSAGPRRVLLLLDSGTLGRLPASKRFRMRFKPMAVPDDEMILRFDAAIGASPDVRRFLPDGMPFLWMPGGSHRGEPMASTIRAPGPLRIGYFGALSDYSGVLKFLELFHRGDWPFRVLLSGYGKQAERITALAASDSRIEFRGFLPNSRDCRLLARECDILINPRPLEFGNENNFPSKIFEYAASGRAVLTSRLSGVDEVLGPDAFYFDAARFEPDLGRALDELRAGDFADLNHRGAAIQRRVLEDYGWNRQGRRIAEFLDSLKSGI
jgi:glycosyltransferase involved in cell wall biosynthesis